MSDKSNHEEDCPYLIGHNCSCLGSDNLNKELSDELDEILIPPSLFGIGDWESWTSERIKHHKAAFKHSPNYIEAKAKLEAYVNNAVVAARKDELERLNMYYLRHDGEGEHKLAAQFDIRIKSLTKKGQNSDGNS